MANLFKQICNFSLYAFKVRTLPERGTNFILETVREMAETGVEVFNKTNKDFEALYGASPISTDIYSVIAAQSRRLLTQLKK